MQFSNRVVSYFSFRSDSGIEVYRAPVTINSKTAKSFIEEEQGRSVSLPLHVCFDVDSGLIYTPNRLDFDKCEAQDLFQAAKLKIVMEFKNISGRPPIDGSPFSSLRIRSVKSFGNISNSIASTFPDMEIDNLPVLEVNLSRMPNLLKHLPEEYRDNSELIGSYIGKMFAKSISFVEEIGVDGKLRPDPIHLLTQQTPFILINVSPTTDPKPAEKEWIVLSSYRDHLEAENMADLDDIMKFSDLYAIKRYLYLGWSFEEVSALLLKDVKDFGELIKGISLLMDVVDSLEEEGYDNPSRIPYLISMKINALDFPFNLNTLIDLKTGELHEDIYKMQYDHFKVVGYDIQTSYILIQTSAFISAKICDIILKAKSRPMVCKYDDNEKEIVVKSEEDSYQESRKIDHGRQLLKIKAMYIKILGLSSDELEFKVGKGSYGVKGADPLRFVKRKLSEYYYVSDFIKHKVCKKHNEEFKDFEIVVGPVERLFGQGVQGGFMSRMAFVQSGLKVPYEIDKDLKVSPPVIFLNSISVPSYAEQAGTLVHEYRHYIYSERNPFYKNRYNSIEDVPGDNHYKKWYLYLTDPNEREAHKTQVQYELLTGQSVDEIIRNKVGGEVTKENYQIALKFMDIVEEAILEEEENER